MSIGWSPDYEHTPSIGRAGKMVPQSLVSERLHVLKSDLQRRADVTLDITARVLASEGMVVSEDKETGMTLIGHDSNRHGFTEEDVAKIREVLSHWVDKVLRER